MVSPRGRVLIGAGELMQGMQSGERPALLDVRWRLDQPDGRQQYQDGHLPGAVYVSLEDELSDHTWAGRGRHPLPSGAHLQAAARRWGLRAGRPVVAYDDWNRAGSARAWWVLTAAGLTDVRILDGGLAAWVRAGGQLESGPQTDYPPGDVTIPHPDLYHGALPTLTAEQVAGGAAEPLLDARAPERFRGDAEPVDAAAGHIPGARNRPSTSLLNADGMFRTDLDPVLAEDGVLATATTGVYCGSGITASVVVAALANVGVEAALFPGSWSQWSSDPTRPIARGAEAGPPVGRSGSPRGRP